MCRLDTIQSVLASGRHNFDLVNPFNDSNAHQNEAKTKNMACTPIPWWKHLSTAEDVKSQLEVKSSQSSQTEVNQVPTEFNELVNLMIEHCLKPNPNAEKWNEVKLSLFKVKPEVENWDTSYVGRAWGVAKAHFKPLKPQGKPLEDSEAPPLKPLEVTEVIPEGLQGALSIASKPQQGLTPPGSPLQVNFYMGKDGSQGASVGSRGASERLSTPKIGSGVASKTLAEEARALRALAKQAYKVCKTMIEKGVTYLQLLAAVEMIVGSEGRGLVERVSTLTIGLTEGLFACFTHLC